MTKEMKSKKKPLSFSTTMRNPSRIAGFLNQLNYYENEILTTEIIFKIIHEVIKNKLYYTMYEKRNSGYKKICDSEKLEFTDDQVDDIIENSPQNHKQAGFEKGWESRFQTWYSLMQEFGFVMYEKNKEIKISSTGKMLIEAYTKDPIDEETIQNVLLNSMTKYQTNNPYKKNSNENTPLVLLLKVINLLKSDKRENGAGIYRNELSLFICWENNDANQLYEKIKKIRKDVGFNYSDEYMYNVCLDVLGYKTDEEKNKIKKYFKMNKICGEAIDEYIRKMRSTGIISLRGNGRFLDINSFESKKISYILKEYGKIKTFSSKKNYYDYLGTMDSEFINTNNEIEHIDEFNIKLDTLYKYAKEYSKEYIFNELIILSDKKESKDSVFKYIPAPTRLEFLTSISLVQSLTNCIIEPNYSIDDEGLPTMTAKGEMPDIACVDASSTVFANIEVTLMKGRSDQTNNEIIPIRRHILSKTNLGQKGFGVFIAPYIHEDTREMAKWYQHKDQIDIYVYTIKDYIDKLSDSIELDNFKVCE